MNKKDLKIILLIIFVFFLSIGFLIPYTGDDWNNLINHKDKLIALLISYFPYVFKNLYKIKIEE